MFVLPVEGITSQRGGDNEGVYDYAQEGGAVAELFGDFCRQSLCMESWDFVLDSIAYKVRLSLSVDQPRNKYVHHRPVPQRVSSIIPWNPKEKFALPDVQGSAWGRNSTHASLYLRGSGGSAL